MGIAKVEMECEDDPEEFGDDTDLVPLTEELKSIFGDNKFKTEEELYAFMDKAGTADFQVILVVKSCTWESQQISITCSLPELSSNSLGGTENGDTLQRLTMFT